MDKQYGIVNELGLLINTVIVDDQDKETLDRIIVEFNGSNAYEIPEEFILIYLMKTCWDGEKFVNPEDEDTLVNPEDV
jgi:hypothetical protein